MKQLKAPSILNTFEHKLKGLFIINIVIIITNLVIDTLLQDYRFYIGNSYFSSSILDCDSFS